MNAVRWLTFATMLLLPAAGIGAPPAQAPAQAPMKSVQVPMQAPSKSVQAPVQAPNKVQVPAQVPAKTAMAADNSGYRTYSYQPTMAPMNYGSGYGYGYGTGPAYRTRAAAGGFNRADHKLIGY